MEKKKILLVYYKLFKPGGVAKVMTTLANELTEQGYDVEILLMMSNLNTFYELNPKIKLHHVDMFSHWAFKICVFNKKYLGKVPKIDNINTYISHIGVFLLLRNWMRKNHHHYDSIISCWYKLSCFLAMNKTVAYKTLAWEHADYNTSGVLFGRLRKNYKNLKHIVAINKPGYKFYKTQNKTELISNIIGEPFESNEFSTDKENLISFVGRLDREKNVQELINIFASAKIPSDWKLQIIGDGMERKNLEESATKLKINHRVIFHGTKNSDEINSLLNNSKIFGFTSKKEALPLVLVEAMFCSNVIIAYDCNYGPSDIINENNGFLIPLGNQELFKEKLETLIISQNKIEEKTKSSFLESQKWKKENIIEQWKKIV